MKQKNFERTLYSTAGVVAMFVVLLAFYVISSAFKTRADLTAEKAYTLSKGTKNILGKLDSRVTIRFYCTQSDNAMPVQFKTYARRVEDLLGEYKQAGHGKIVIEKFDPKPDSDAEDSARLNGVEGQMTQPMGGDRIYLGLVVSMLDEKVALPFLSPDREKLLEYDISRAVARVINPTRPVVGVMSALPIFGEQANPMMRRMNRQQGSEPYVFVSELKKDFDLKEIPMTAEKIDDDIKVLVAFHPRDISEQTQYAIDQFVLRGGKLLAFIDSHAYFDQKQDQMAQVVGESSGTSTLEKLIKTWGLQFDTGKVVADMNFASRGQVGMMPAVLMLNKEGVNNDDIVTSQIDNLVMPFAGAFTGTPADGLKQTVLLKTTQNSQLVDSIMSSIGSENIAKEFKASGTAYPLAVRLTGKFKTAFPDGKPKAAKKEDEKDAPAPPEDKSEQLKESKVESAVILVGDTDFLNDQVCVQVQEFFGQRIVIPKFGNLNFVQSLVEQLSGDSNLISLRSRASLNRPFTLVQKMEAEAQKSYQSKIKEMEESLAEAQRKLNELQAKKQGPQQQRFILSPEQQAEVENFKKKEMTVKKDLKELRKKLHQDTEALEFRTKVINIGAMPVIVAITGVVLAAVKRKKQAAK